MVVGRSNYYYSFCFDAKLKLDLEEGDWPQAEASRDRSFKTGFAIGNTTKC